MTLAAVAVLGTGRVGLTLARALVLSGTPVRLLGRTAQSSRPGLPAVEMDWVAALADVALVIVTVPDDAIVAVARQLASLGTIGPGQVILHTSGLHGKDALAPLASSGAALGSMHPLQAFTSDQNAADLLRGVPAIVEGDPAAVAAARRMALSLGMGTTLELQPGDKVKYHAAAVVASNYLVVLAEMAERLAREAGAGDAAASLFQPIMQRTLAHVAELGVVAALTGPVRRGDVGTVARHLEVLQGNDRVAYIALAREALELARRAGLAPGAIVEMESILNS